MAVSLWANFTDGEYADTIIYQNSSIMIVNYCGQKNSRNDTYIGDGNYFFYKNKKGGDYIFTGRVVHSRLIRTTVQDEKTINIYELVISKGPLISFRIKRDAYEHFGWAENGQDFMSGIINHVLA